MAACSGDDDDASPPIAGPTVDPAGHVGIPVGETPDGLRLCFAGDTPEEPTGGSQVALYGMAAAADPYAGPMLGVFWAPGGEDAEGFAGDGDRTPVEVRGTEGVAAPITVFQQTVLPQLGTVVAWQEDGLEVGLFGREWPAARTAELVALAGTLRLEDGRFAFPDDAVPAGYELLYRGSAASLGLLAPRFDYQVTYRNGDGQGGGMVTLLGLHGSVEEFEAFRFLALDLDQANLHGSDTVTGNAWDPTSGPAVVSWREPDGRIVRIVGVGVELPVVNEFAQYTRQLTPDEWDELRAAATPCD